MHMKAQCYSNQGLWVLTFFLFIAHSAAAQWNKVEEALQARSEASSLVYEGKYYVFLGFGNSDLVPATSSEVYDPATGTWKLLKAIPEDKAMTHQGVARLNDQVWHIGGRKGNHPGPLTNEIWIYNITTDSWSQGPSILKPATGEPLFWAAGGAVFLGRTLHVFGGFEGTACNGDQKEYHLTLDVDAWLSKPEEPAPWKNELAPMPLQRNHFGTVVLNGKIYAIGGQIGHDCRGGHDQPWAHVYDPNTNKWQRLPNMPVPRSHVEGSTFTLDGKIYVLGGQVAGSVNTQFATVFDPEANNGRGQWYHDNTLLLPSAYEGPAAKVIGSTVLFSHGGEGSSRNPRNILYAQSIARNPNYRFLFPASCASFNVHTGGTAKGQTLLFTSDSSADYTVSATAAWLKPTDNATGQAQVNGVSVGYMVDASNLAPGKYQANLVVQGSGFAEASYCVSITVGGSVMEAENAAYSGAIVANDHQEYTGSGYVDYQNPAGDFIEWTVEMPEAKTVMLKFRYANGNKANRPMELTLNETVLNTEFSFPSTGNWGSWVYIDTIVNMAAGVNKVRLTANGFSGPNMDHLAIEIKEDEVLSTMSKKAAPSAARYFNVAPNPVSGTARLVLNWSPEKQVTVQVLDRVGAVHKQIQVDQVKDRQILVPVENLPPANYIVVVREGSFIMSRQILIIR